MGKKPNLSDTIKAMTSDLTILEPKDAQLRRSAAVVTRAQLRTKTMQETIERLLDFVYGHNNKGDDHERAHPMTVGLSAPQVGINRRMSVVDLAIGSKLFNDIHVLINPVIISHGKATADYREGCINLPRIWGSVKRYKNVTVQALDRSGNILTLGLTGWPAALLQHEIDHLDGRLFIDRLEDPAHAHFIDSEHFKEYNKKTAANWPYYVDVRDLVKPL